MTRPRTLIIRAPGQSHSEWSAYDEAQIDNDRCCNLGAIGHGCTPDAALADYDAQVAEMEDALCAS